MRLTSSGSSGDGDKAHSVIHAGAITGPNHAIRIGGFRSGSRTKDVVRDGHAEIEKHAEQAKPCQQLYQRELPHGLRHVGQGVQNFREVEFLRTLETLQARAARADIPSWSES